MNNILKVIYGVQWYMYQNPLIFMRRCSACDSKFRNFDTLMCYINLIETLSKNNFNVISKSRHIGMTTFLLFYSIWNSVVLNKKVLFVVHSHVEANRLTNYNKKVTCQLPWWVKEISKNNQKIIIRTPELHDANFEKFDLIVFDNASLIRNFDVLINDVFLRLIRNKGCVIVTSSIENKSQAFSKLYASTFSQDALYSLTVI